ncbi:hypothetical protein PF011_g13850 [Phytophthora fragariae]|uniref:Uncharacterized protein n=1 Tax=Phytophthora fragariae TaxID=53985 RepID=A0A6A3KBC3_9STRA|nr:hypothetical protein PF011_g13850 [Phytophthora fragariae]
MVRLTSRSFLHLTPEVVQFEAELPFYAKVLQLGSEEVMFHSLEGGEGKVDRRVAEDRVVLAREVTRSGRTSLLRRPVSVKLNAEVHYGQLVAIKNDRLTVQFGDQQLRAVASAVSVVSPVVALLLEDIEFRSGDWSSSDLEVLEQAILSRVLGHGGETASDEVSSILDGLMSEESHPVGSKMCRWIDTKTGELTHFTLQHAINFAYYVDGGVSPVPQSVGSSFNRTPIPPSSTSGISVGSGQSVQELFDPFVDDDDSPQDDLQRDRGNVSPDVAFAPVKKRSHESTLAVAVDRTSQAKRQCHRNALDQDALILAKLSGEPDGLDRFLSIREDAKAQVLPDAQPEVAAARPMGLHKSSAGTKGKQTSKYTFAPSDDQVLLHERVTSENHKGKSANVFCRSLVRSEHVEFKAVPGVCTRAYDIRFGSGGLSIRHFARLSRDERVSWLASGGSNYDNLSVTAAFSAAPPAARIEDVVDSARVFLTYTREFCCAELTELVENIVKFIDHTLAQVSWAPKELSCLVYWVNDVLEDFRCATDEGRELRTILQRCTTDDKLLRDVMFVKVPRQMEDARLEIQRGPARSEGPPVSSSQRHSDRNTDGKKRFGRIHKEALRKLPVQVDPGSGKYRNLCMRYLSQASCAEDGDGGCPSEHGHFVPKTLPAIVKNEIGRRFGGLKDEHKQL